MEKVCFINRDDEKEHVRLAAESALRSFYIIGVMSFEPCLSGTCPYLCRWAGCCLEQLQPAAGDPCPALCSRWPAKKVWLT